MGWIWVDQAFKPIYGNPSGYQKLENAPVPEEGKRIGFCGFARLGRHD
jgi:hypothetical protein